MCVGGRGGLVFWGGGGGGLRGLVGCWAAAKPDGVWCVDGVEAVQQLLTATPVDRLRGVGWGGGDDSDFLECMNVCVCVGGGADASSVGKATKGFLAIFCIGLLSLMVCGVDREHGVLAVWGLCNNCWAQHPLTDCQVCGGIDTLAQLQPLSPTQLLCWLCGANGVPLQAAAAHVLHPPPVASHHPLPPPSFCFLGLGGAVAAALRSAGVNSIAQLQQLHPTQLSSLLCGANGVPVQATAALAAKLSSWGWGRDTTPVVARGPPKSIQVCAGVAG